jgi:hypothetical protein
MDDHVRSFLLRDSAQTWAAGVEMELERLRTFDHLEPWRAGGQAVVLSHARTTVSC